MKKNQQELLLNQLKGIISKARLTAVRNINALQVASNYLIGKQIVEFEQQGSGRAEYGKGLLRDLSSVLSGEFGKGYSHSNLSYMRNFYLLYADKIEQKFQTVSGILLDIDTEHALEHKHTASTVRRDQSLVLVQQLRRIAMSDCLRQLGHSCSGSDLARHLPPLGSITFTDRSRL